MNIYIYGGKEQLLISFIYNTYIARSSKLELQLNNVHE